MEAECRHEKLIMKINQRVQIPVYSAVLFLATLLQAGASDGASFVSETIPTNTVMAPGQTFTETWTLQNTGATTWSPGASGYTLFLAGMDGREALLLSTNRIPTNSIPTRPLTLEARLPQGRRQPLACLSLRRKLPARIPTAFRWPTDRKSTRL